MARHLASSSKTFFHHEAIKDVAVHSVLSEIGEDDVKVTAVLRDGAELSAEDLCTWAVSRLAISRSRATWRLRGSLPRTPTGRVQKYQLRDEGKTPDTWDREAAGSTFDRR